MEQTDVDQAGLCWWCGEARPGVDLFHLEGARIWGSPELCLPESLSEVERIAMRICRGCAFVFAGFRRRHDEEVFVGGSTTVADALRRTFGAE